MLGRGILCLFVAGDIRNLLLYPEVFAFLVLDKAYSVTKSALVPGLVADDSDLVAANSRLARIATVASLFSGAIAVGILNAADAVQVLRVASLLYFAATFLAMRIPADTASRSPSPRSSASNCACRRCAPPRPRWACCGARPAFSCSSSRSA